VSAHRWLQDPNLFLLIYADGLALSHACELRKLGNARIWRIHKVGVETVQKLLLQGAVAQT
jgi:hypothetical protein